MYFIKFVCLFCLEKVSAVYLCHMVIILYLFNSENMYKSTIYRVHRVFIAHFVCVKVRFLGSEWTAKLSMFGTPKREAITRISYIGERYSYLLAL